MLNGFGSNAVTNGTIGLSSLYKLRSPLNFASNTNFFGVDESTLDHCTSAKIAPLIRLRITTREFQYPPITIVLVGKQSNLVSNLPKTKIWKSHLIRRHYPIWWGSLFRQIQLPLRVMLQCRMALEPSSPSDAVHRSHSFRAISFHCLRQLF